MFPLPADVELVLSDHGRAVALPVVTQSEAVPRCDPPTVIPPDPPVLPDTTRFGEGTFAVGVRRGPVSVDWEHPSLQFTRDGWTRTFEHPWDPEMPNADRVGDDVRLWTRGASCGETSSGCWQGYWQIEPEIRATFPVRAGACIAGERALARGSVVVLGDEVVALKDGVAFARFALPWPTTGILSDEDKVLVQVADGTWWMVQWTGAVPTFRDLPVEGPIWAIDGDVLLTDDAVVGIDGWRVPGRPVAAIRTAEGLWVLVGGRTTRVVLLDPATGARRAGWTVAKGAPRYAGLEGIGPGAAVPGTTVAVNLAWIEP